MEILGLHIETSNENKEILRRFFDENEDFIFNSSFIEYDTIKTFGDMYEAFLNENNLRDNEFLMLFLAEIRYDQIAYKLTDNTNRRKVERMYIPKERLNSTISKWYHESRETIPVKMPLKDELYLKKKLEQNAYEYQKGEEIASNKIVR